METITLPLLSQGKVRNVYEVDAEMLLFVASDRVSAYDVILNSTMPGKGTILTELSCFWFKTLADVVPNHLITADVDVMPACVQPFAAYLRGRAMLVKRLTILPVEAIVRGYITGSAWSAYAKTGAFCGAPLGDAPLLESQKLPRPLFTPSTKAAIGDHDENISVAQLAEQIGADRAAEIERVALALYERAAEHAAARGILIADTKFEFGVDADGRLVLADEVLTPDSSRFWDAATYEVGKSQQSFDKQYVRDYLTSIGFDKKTPVTLPEQVIAKTMEKYSDAVRRLTSPPAASSP
ncbi:hypothetical protein CXG81DRAFT_23852 [Caulochytrium protostelioides]|uniref:Phosphoribosylaminoimidazole-succinocarboxamide synthase n=1 Tax=Caulochytrium protostelioides TaxID=1555241 RepID=A0A4P9XDK4_9FUNG|nr:saicar synthetase [Caulochytrium protostelioides]RKP03594.1 hypothetical protein CXG81DRAFT_23852 [Caulochytrium protostelioides]|eukprot:RKP03594.1 hypothetical protein CXG81DRAFT_23852 [Caulochytrium protostelioides]